MSHPTTTGAIAPLSFADRLPLVREAVEQRISQTPTANAFALRARLWVSWLNRTVLDVPTYSGVRV